MWFFFILRLTGHVIHDPGLAGTGNNYVYLIGSDYLSTDLYNICEDVNDKYTALNLDYKYNDRKDPEHLYYRSDHYNFAKNGIPSVFIFSGIHEDYHKSTDDPEKIEFDALEKIKTNPAPHHIRSPTPL